MKSTILLISLAMMLSASGQVFPQKFKLPPIPAYDSVQIDQYEGKIQEKNYFLKKQKVFEIGYNTGGMFYVPFFAIGGGTEDSCYAYFNGPTHESYDFYYMARDYIINERFAENSRLFKYRKFHWNTIPIEEGNYYFIREMYQQFIAHNTRYKIGKWTTYDASGKVARVNDYDNGTQNGLPVQFKGNMKIIDSLKTLARKKIISVYGNDFYTKYVRFNLDRSGYYPYDRPRPEQPGGISLLEPTKENIQFVDLSYDIVLGDQRFNAIQFRISRQGKFLGRTYYPDFATNYFYLTQGLDSLNNGRLHANVINWKKIAGEKGFDITSKGFNIRMDFKPTSDYYGQLRLVLEQVTESVSNRHSFTNKLKQYFINPWTGEIKEASDEEGVQSIMVEEEGI